jgi:hypothetical protein
LHEACVSELYPSRRVQSIYLDTHEGRALADNLAGVSAREKIRFRWYGDATDRARGALERKVRRAGVGWKELVPIDEELELEGAPRARFVERLAAHAPPAWDLSPVVLGPAQWIAYTREYYRTADRSVRITLDRDLAAFDQRYAPELQARFRTPLPRLLVVELKAEGKHEAALRAFASTFPLVYDKSSKFVLASSPKDAPIVSVLTG